MLRALALAELASNHLKPKDRACAAAPADRYRRRFEADNRDRGRTDTAGARYAPFLSKWIETGAWKEADKLVIPGETTAEQAAALDNVEYVDRVHDEALFKVCERIRDKPAHPDIQRFAPPRRSFSSAS